VVNWWPSSVTSLPHWPSTSVYSTLGARHCVVRVCQRQRRLLVIYTSCLRVYTDESFVHTGCVALRSVSLRCGTFRLVLLVSFIRSSCRWHLSCHGAGEFQRRKTRKTRWDTSSTGVREVFCWTYSALLNTWRTERFLLILYFLADNNHKKGRSGYKIPMQNWRHCGLSDKQKCSVSSFRFAGFSGASPAPLWLIHSPPFQNCRSAAVVEINELLNQLCCTYIGGSERHVLLSISG